MIVDDLVQSELNRSISILIDRVWRLPSPDDRVVYDLWTIPSDKVSKDFAMFRDIAKSAGQRACFTPQMYISDGVRSHCQGNLDEKFCYNLCTNNKRFCATDSDNVAVADVVRKSDDTRRSIKLLGCGLRWLIKLSCEISLQPMKAEYSSVRNSAHDERP